jgi:hypothetical protein
MSAHGEPKATNRDTDSVNGGELGEHLSSKKRPDQRTPGKAGGFLSGMRETGEKKRAIIGNDFVTYTGNSFVT